MVLPFLMMVIVNELVRPSLKEKPYSSHGVTAMNSAKVDKGKCSWNCHNDTNYCKQNHVKLLKDYFEYTDPVYFGIIHLLKSTGNYGLANIVFLVILFPLIMYILLIKSIDMNRQIHVLKSKKNHE